MTLTSYNSLGHKALNLLQFIFKTEKYSHYENNIGFEAIIKKRKRLVLKTYASKKEDVKFLLRAGFKKIDIAEYELILDNPDKF